MKRLVPLLIALFFSLPTMATDTSKEKPTQHLKVPEITSMAVAKDVFLDTTARIRSMKQLNPDEAGQIHVITYSLEKSVAYFVDNLTGNKQVLARQMAVVVEDIHIASENNRPETLRKHLDKYAELVDQFLFGF